MSVIIYIFVLDKFTTTMTNEERILLLENRCERMDEDFEILHRSISRLPAIVLGCFVSGLIAGVLLCFLL